MRSYKVLDLADEKGYLCGKILADLGASVIKIEKPGGDLSRNIGPFYHDKADGEKSLSWFAYNSNKKGITLDIENKDGRELFLRLVERSDVIIESFPPGKMRKLGLGYNALKRGKKDIILASISAFGGKGPYSSYKADDLTVSAMGGMAYLTGDEDRAPVRTGVSHCFNLAAANGAVAVVTALYHREKYGRGQHIDVSAQECQVWGLMTILPFWEQSRKIYRRAGPYRLFFKGQRERQTWRCKDGYLAFVKIGGAGGAKANKALVEWMDSEGMATEFLKNMDWEAFDMASCPQETHDKTEEAMGRFFLSHTKKELYEGAVKRGILLYPAFEIGDLLKYEQLKERGFWEKVEHPELGESITYPGASTIIKTAPLREPIRAPGNGEHNEEIYLKELGLNKEEYLLLKQGGII